MEPVTSKLGEAIARKLLTTSGGRLKTLALGTKQERAISEGVRAGFRAGLRLGPDR